MADAGPWLKYQGQSASASAPSVDKPWLKYSGDPSTAASPAAPGFLEDKPGTTYGTVLPFAKDDQTGKVSLALPEMIRQPLRGAVEWGKGLMGQLPPGTQETPDMAAAVLGMGGMKPTPIGGAAQAAKSAIAPTRAMLAKEAIEKFGIPLTGPQIGTNPTTKFAESAIRHLPLSGAGSEERVVREAFNRALSKTIGEDSPVITQEVMRNAKLKLGNTINRIEEAATVKLEPPHVNSLAVIESEARTALTDQEFGVVKRNLDSVFGKLETGDTIPGKTHASLLHQGSPLDRAIDSDNPNIAFYSGRIKEVLQDALQGSLPPDVAEVYKTARFRYKNMKTIEPLVNKSPDGNISPALLSQRVTQQFKNRAYDATGDNPLDRLGKIGQAFLKEPSTSSTSERGAVKAALAKTGELGAAVAAGNFLGIPATAIGAGAALGAGRLTGNYLRSPGLAQRTINKALAPPQSARPSAYPNILSPFPGAAAPLPGQMPNISDYASQVPGQQ